MSRQAPILDGTYQSAKKKKALERLVERYYGKLDLLAAWDNHPSPPPDYIRDLKKRLRTHKNDLIYRGHGDVGDLPIQHS
jgi:hypothetical protein